MARKPRDVAGKDERSPREREITSLRALPRGQRTEEQIRRLAELQAEERRDRWNRLSPGRFKRLKGALKGLMQLSNPASYQYTPEEAAAICDTLDRRAKQVRAAFMGAPEEKGLIDL